MQLLLTTFISQEIRKIRENAAAFNNFDFTRKTRENSMVFNNFDFTRKIRENIVMTQKWILIFQVCGTPTYVAPEILAETGYGVKVDVWATGVIMYILLVGFPPFSSRTNNQEELFDQILSGLFEFNSPDWDDISYSAKELISWMLQVDPLQRYSAYEVLEHPWIKSCFWKKKVFQWIFQFTLPTSQVFLWLFPF